MSRSTGLAAAALAAVMAAGGAQAHGVGARPLGPGAQSVEFYYASGEPMAHVAVRLFAPGDATAPYIDGRADKFGRFAFLPSEPGAWTARAEDEEGHKVELTVQAGEAGAAGGSPGGLLSPWRVALWLSLSANLLAAATWMRARWPASVQPMAARQLPLHRP